MADDPNSEKGTHVGGDAGYVETHDHSTRTRISDDHSNRDDSVSIDDHSVRNESISTDDHSVSDDSVSVDDHSSNDINITNKSKRHEKVGGDKFGDNATKITKNINVNKASHSSIYLVAIIAIVAIIGIIAIIALRDNSPNTVQISDKAPIDNNSVKPETASKGLPVVESNNNTIKPEAVSKGLPVVDSKKPVRIAESPLDVQIWTGQKRNTKKENRSR